MKKPAQLGDNLLSVRPRKGEAKPQSEQDASTNQESTAKSNASQEATATPRRRRRVSDKKLQLNLRVSEKSLERFTKIADDEGVIFGDLFESMLNYYEKKK